MKRYEKSKYLISQDGCVINEKTGREIKWQSNGNGYFKVTLTIKGVQFQRYIHRLVCSLYNPASEFIGAQVNHIDGNKNNNSHLNLEWVTNSENQIHAHKTGLKANGNKLWNGKFSKSDIAYIKDLKKEGKKQNWIAEHMDTTKSTISEIINNKRYKYI